MGELLLCSQEIASVPYYIETAALNVYSLEELCYYLMHNMELIEPGFMDAELCRWIKKELKMSALAEKLKKLLREDKGLAEFVLTLISGCNYCTTEEIRKIQESLAVFENKTEAECAKIRADRFLAQGRYSLCIKEYNRLLELPEVLEGSGLLAGNIWHNLGTAYAGLFLFLKAADCYERAHRRNGNQISLQQAAEAKRLAESVEHEEMNITANEADALLEQWMKEYRRSSR
ncbi:MAG: hypothetical protein J6A75_13050 [Lachnospiraceae bacterium]|nr:hypothetical protein [Lachnospiraceae bacterium]